MNQKIINDLRDALSDILEAAGTNIPTHLRNRAVNACLAHEKSLYETISFTPTAAKTPGGMQPLKTRTFTMKQPGGRNPIKWSVGPVTLYHDATTGEVGAMEDGIYLKMSPDEWEKISGANRTIHLREIFEDRPEEVTGPACECGHTAYLLWTRKAVSPTDVDVADHTYDLTTVCERCGKEVTKKSVIVLGDLGWNEFMKKGGDFLAAFKEAK